MYSIISVECNIGYKYNQFWFATLLVNASPFQLAWTLLKRQTPHSKTILYTILLITLLIMAILAWNIVHTMEYLYISNIALISTNMSLVIYNISNVNLYFIANINVHIDTRKLIGNFWCTLCPSYENKRSKIKD